MSPRSRNNTETSSVIEEDLHVLDLVESSRKEQDGDDDNMSITNSNTSIMGESASSDAILLLHEEEQHDTVEQEEQQHEPSAQQQPTNAQHHQDDEMQDSNTLIQDSSEPAAVTTPPTSSHRSPVQLGPEQLELLQLTRQLEHRDRAQKQQHFLRQQQQSSSSSSSSMDHSGGGEHDQPVNRILFPDHNDNNNNHCIRQRQHMLVAQDVVEEVNVDDDIEDIDVDEVDVDACVTSSTTTTTIHGGQTPPPPPVGTVEVRTPPRSRASLLEPPLVSPMTPAAVVPPSPMSPEEFAQRISDEQRVLLQLARQLEQQDQLAKQPPQPPAATTTHAQRRRPSDSHSHLLHRHSSSSTSSRLEQSRSEWESKRAALSPRNSLSGSFSSILGSNSSSSHRPMSPLVHPTKAGLSSHHNSNHRHSFSSPTTSPPYHPTKAGLSNRRSFSNSSNGSFPPLPVLQPPQPQHSGGGRDQEEEKQEVEGHHEESTRSFAQEDGISLPVSPRSARKGIMANNNSSSSTVPVGAYSFTEGGTLDPHHPSTQRLLHRPGSSSGVTSSGGAVSAHRNPNVEPPPPPEPINDTLMMIRNHSSGEEDILVQARLVRDDDSDHDSERARRRPRAESCDVVEATPVVKKPYSHRCLVASGLFGLALIAMGIVAYVNIKNNNLTISLTTATEAPEPPKLTPPPGPILQRVADRGKLLCGVHGLIRELVDWFGPDAGIEDFFDLAICQAVAAAVLGDGSKFRAVHTDFDDPYQQLAQGNVDMVVSFNTLNMMDDIQEETTGLGFSYSTPYIYLEEVFGGNRTYIDCAERFDTSGECSDMMVCFVEGTEKFSLFPRFPAKNIYLVENVVDLIASYKSGECQVASVLKGDFQRVMLKLMGHEGNFELGNVTTNRGGEGLAVLTVDGDSEWSSFVDTIILAILAAEKANISQDSAENFGQTDLFGDDYKNMLINAISEIGPYGEMYAREVDPFFPRTGINQLNDGSTGLIQAYKIYMPFTQGPAPSPNSTLARILDRQELLCAIRPDRPGFAFWDDEMQQWSGFDVDYCLALGAVLFGGKTEHVTFVQVLDQAEGYTKLASNKVDIMAGATWNIRNAVKERATGAGYCFSQPYFYDPMDTINPNTNATLSARTMNFDENLSLATRNDDAQWSSFVFWTVSFTFDAEHQDTRESAVNVAIPEVNLFGPDFKRMFRDILLSVSHYGDIYSRNLPFLPRSGRNLAVPLDQSHPRHYVPPGFFD